MRIPGGWTKGPARRRGSAADHGRRRRHDREVVACRPDDDVTRAEQLMGSRQKSRSICTDKDGRLAGVISLSDIAQVEEGSRASETMKQVTDREARPH
jgi:CBS domain-containing protein